MGKTPAMYYIVWFLEDVADSYDLLLKYIQKNKIKLSKEQLSVYKDIASLWKQCHGLFINYSNDNAVALAKTHDKIITAIDKLEAREKSVKSALLLERMRVLAGQIVRIMGQQLLLQ